MSDKDEQNDSISTKLTMQQCKDGIEPEFNL